MDQVGDSLSNVEVDAYRVSSSNLDDILAQVCEICNDLHRFGLRRLTKPDIRKQHVRFERHNHVLVNESDLALKRYNLSAIIKSLGLYPQNGGQGDMAKSKNGISGQN